MPWIAAIVAVAGLAVSVAGKVKEGQAQSDAAEYDAAKAASNAIVVRQQAAEDERVFRVENRKLISGMNANVGASGLSSEGSPEQVIGESAANGELDALKLRQAGEVKALGYQSDVNLDSMRAQAYSSGATLSAAGQLLGGAGSLYNTYARSSNAASSNA